MAVFANKADLIEAYQAQNELDGAGFIHSQIYRAKPVYVPHLYRGGYVIRGFGYSVERIGIGNITPDNAGNPFLV